MNRGRDWNSSVAKIVEMGKFLALKRPSMTAKEFNDYGLAEFGVGRATMGKVIRIAENPVLSNPEYWDRLPAKWGLLYELLFLEPKFLVEKIESGEIKDISKYKLWDIRGVKLTRSPSNSKVRFPSDQTLTNYVRSAMALQIRDGLDLQQTAAAMQLQADTYRRVRALIMLSERPELSDDDRTFVLSLLDKIDKTRNVRPYHQQAVPLIERFWGKQRNKDVNDRVVQKRIDAFRSTIIILNNTCEKLDELEVPYMSDEDINQSINELADAGRLIRKLAENLRRSKNG